MAGESRVTEKLRALVAGLSPTARAMLLAEIERCAEQGENLPLGDFLLAELRAGLPPNVPEEPVVVDFPPQSCEPAVVCDQPEAGDGNFAEALRLFAEPFARLLVEDAPDAVHPGRMSNAAFSSIWTWILRDVAAQEADALAGQLVSLPRDGEDARAAVRSFQDIVLERVDRALAGTAPGGRSGGRLGAQIGTPRAQDDLRQLSVFLSQRDTLVSLANRIAALRGSGEERLDAMVALLQTVHTRHPQLFPSALALAMATFPVFWQPVRIAIRAAQSDSVARIAETPFAAAVSMVLAELDRFVRLLAADLKRGELKSAAGRLKDIHDAVRGLRAELDLSSGAGWAREIAAKRAQIADCLKSEIEAVPGRVRRLLRAKPGLALGALDPHEVAEAERSIAFLNACRAFASELALNEMTMRVFSELQHYLETTTEQLVDSLRNAGPAQDYRHSQVDAAVRFCAKVFGADYAQLLARAAEVALQDDRKVAERA